MQYFFLLSTEITSSLDFRFVGFFFCFRFWLLILDLNVWICFLLLWLSEPLCNCIKNEIFFFGLVFDWISICCSLLNFLLLLFFFCVCLLKFLLFVRLFQIKSLEFFSTKNEGDATTVKSDSLTWSADVCPNEKDNFASHPCWVSINFCSWTSLYDNIQHFFNVSWICGPSLLFVSSYNRLNFLEMNKLNTFIKSTFSLSVYRFLSLFYYWIIHKSYKKRACWIDFDFTVPVPFHSIPDFKYSIFLLFFVCFVCSVEKGRIKRWLNYSEKCVFNYVERCVEKKNLEWDSFYYICFFSLSLSLCLVGEKENE